MQHLNRLTKIAITILTFGFILWFGGSVMRSAIAFDIIIPGVQVGVKSSYPVNLLMHSVYNFGMLASYTDFGYIIALIAALYLVIIWRKQLRERGWLFMAFILFFLTVPIEGYLIYMDIKLSIAIYWNNVRDFYNPDIQKFFFERYKSVTITTMSGLAFLSSITSVLYLIWRPLNKTENVKHESGNNESQ